MAIPLRFTPRGDRNAKTSKPLLLVIVLYLIATICQSQSSQPLSQEKTGKLRPAKSIVYTNKQYGFKFYLPENWKGYSIIAGKWGGGIYQEEPTQPAQFDEGPKITFRHPLLTEEEECQDILIKVFTYAQWDLILRGDLLVSAAPVGRSEIGRNSRYVFALPPRYNYADVVGVEEVNNIIQTDPLHAF